MVPIPSYPGYSIGPHGDVYTHRRRKGLGKGNGGIVVIDSAMRRKLNPYRGHGGYQYVAISTSRGQRGIPVHALLMDAFVGPLPKGQEVRHLDGNPANNALANLAYGTRKQNAEDRMRCGKRLSGDTHPRRKLSEEKVADIRSRPRSRLLVASLMTEFGMSESGIRGVLSGRTWK